MSTLNQPTSQHPQPTERFQRVLAFASDEADGLGHGFITCQHLLYALSRESKGLASATLDALGVTPEILHDLLNESAALHDRIQGEIDLAEEVAAAVEGAVRAANQWGHRWVDTEHLLYGIASTRTSADEMFAALHLSPAQILERLGELQNTAPNTVVREAASHAYRFTLESAWLLSLATEVARRYGASMVNSLHLLAALLTLDSPARRVLAESLSVRVEDVERRMRRAESSRHGGGRLPLGEDVQWSLGCAIGEAWNRGHLAVAPLHLAMGLARADQHAALDVLAELGVSQADLVDALDTVMPPPTVR